ncbi:PAS domain-containing protein [Ramlibacter sp. WS9]|uniref:PAS domain-containing protein n=1 Tax=Ramlibacter sp. WS9 TaxID=1882741 RepID=UPI001142A832|nr:PAS domain-containing protein [Ramlibacter sp. WS9]ROZ61802.1 PAS domain S-box protein [Ramlibacter sp. WS9]
MAEVTAFETKDVTGIGDGVAAAWRRLWRRGDAAGRDAVQGPYWTSGVTYRGYLGADGAVPSLWLSEDQLKETQALLRMAAAAGRLGAWSVEVRRLKCVWSDEVKAIYEVPPDYQPRIADTLAFYTPESQECAAAALEACARRGIGFDLELQLQTAKGQLVWIRAIGEADRNAEGIITHIRGAIQDISRFKAVTEEVRRTAERFTRTLEGLTDGFMLLDHEWCFVYVNPEAERILRRDRSRLIGRCLLTEFPETASGRFLEKCQDAIRDRRTVEFEKFYAPLGIWVYMKVSPTEQGLTFCIRDDTERITARRELLRLKAQLSSRAA